MGIQDQLISLVEDLRGQIKIPEISDPYLKTVWIMGRNAGANKVRHHVRHNFGNKFPTLNVAPKAIRQEMGETGADVWLNGFNASVEFVENKVSKLLASFNKQVISAI